MKKIIIIYCVILSGMLLSCQKPTEVEANRRVIVDKDTVPLNQVLAFVPDTVLFSFDLIPSGSLATNKILKLMNISNDSIELNSIELISDNDKFHLDYTGTFPQYLLPMGTADDTKDVKIWFVPDDYGVFDAKIEINGDSSHYADVIAKVYQISASDVDFGTLTDGDTAIVEAMIYNNTDLPLIVREFQIDGDDNVFNVIEMPREKVIPANKNYRYFVMFTAKNPGVYTAVINFFFETDARGSLIKNQINLKAVKKQ